jgi:choline dehydrogenase-like flavoprotein
MNTKYDVIIVGAGAVSNAFAARLAEGNKKVLVLESGPQRKAEDLISSQIWARRLKWGAHPINELENKEMLGTNMNFGIGYGGAAIHHYGVYPRFTEQDFQMKSMLGRGVDWPMAYDDIRPYYDKVQDFLGVSGDAKNEPDRPKGKEYPLPPVPAFRHAELLSEGFNKMGIKTSALPMGVLSQPYNGRPACLWDGWCDAGCPIGAIANPLMTYMPRAQKAGATYQADGHVTRVLTNKKGDKAIGVEYFTKEGLRQEAKAEMVILGANTIENVRILLNSKDGGLANKSKTLGKYLMVHPAVTVYGMYDEETQCHMGATGGALMARQADKTANPDGVFGAYHWEIGLVLKPNDLLGVAMTRPDLIGEELDTFINYGGKRMAAMCAVIEDQPLDENRVELDTDKDQYVTTAKS